MEDGLFFSYLLSPFAFDGGFSTHGKNDPTRLSTMSSYLVWNSGRSWWESSFVDERPSRSYQLNPVSLRVWLTIVRDSVPLIGQHGLDESPHNGKCHGAIVPAWYIS